MPIPCVDVPRLGRDILLHPHYLADPSSPGYKLGGKRRIRTLATVRPYGLATRCITTLPSYRAHPMNRTPVNCLQDSRTTTVLDGHETTAGVEPVSTWSATTPYPPGTLGPPSWCGTALAGPYPVVPAAPPYHTLSHAVPRTPPRYRTAFP